jgi:nucleotide-binding universal stress UspA family protein
MNTQVDTEPVARTLSPFARVVVGIDASPESLEAARQAATLADGPIALVAAYDLADTLVGGVGPGVPAYLDERPAQEIAEQSLAAAENAIADHEPSTQIYRGRPWEALIAAIEAEAATLVAVGSHGTGRALGIVIGSTATELIHKAPCSVLVARPTSRAFPSRIVVGLDGSAESLAAYAAARMLAVRFEAKIDPVVAVLEDDVDPNAIRSVVGRRVRPVFNHPVEALVEASRDADLIVVGSRGLRGLKALGSVSERVAHLAASSVLIVRSPS